MKKRKQITPFKRIDRYAFDKARYKTVEEAEKCIRKDGTEDYIVIDNILYTMEEYDNDGQNIAYYNMRTGNRVEVDTSNRYKNGFGDAKVSLFENYGAWRNGIVYAD